MKSKEVALNTRLNTVAVRVEMGKRENITYKDLKRLVRELPRSFILTGAVTAHSRRWGSSDNDKR
jgi:hypothetical protein